MSVLHKLLMGELSYEPQNKAKFHSEGKKVLRKLAKAMGLDNSQFKVSSNKGGVAVSGEVILHTAKIYVTISQSLYGNNNDVMYRTCNGMMDYTGGQNHLIGITQLENLEEFAYTLNNL